MDLTIKEYKRPKNGDLVATFEIDHHALEHEMFARQNKEYVFELLKKNMVEEIAKHCELSMYKKSVRTGEIYDGYYNYTPAHDPICKTVYELRFEKLNKANEMIGDLHREIARLKRIISNMAGA